MKNIDERVLPMAALTLIVRIASELERRGVLEPGWSAAELRQAAESAERDVQFAANADLQRALAESLKKIAATLDQ